MGHYVYQSTRILDSVADLTEEIKTGKVSDRLNSPAYSHSDFHRDKLATAIKKTPSPITNRGKTGDYESKFLILIQNSFFVLIRKQIESGRIGEGFHATS